MLAAGSARRMGQLKQLLPINEKPVIRHCLETIIDSGINDVVTVLGGGGEKIIEVINDLPVKIVFNKAPQSEMAESFRIGLQAVDAFSTGVLVCLCDHPLVSKETFKVLTHFHEEEPDRILIPVYNGIRGHPTLFPKSVITDIFLGINLREIINRNPDRVKPVRVKDEGVILDMDTTDDYRKILERTGKEK